MTQLKTMKRPEQSNHPPRGPMQVVAHNLSRWVMMLGIGMGLVSAVAFFYGQLVAGSMLLSIFMVSITLYFFIKLWPEEPPGPASRSRPADAPKPRVRVAAVRVDGPPRTRCVMALREMVRRQEDFQISQQGAEMFAKTIRYMLRSLP